MKREAAPGFVVVVRSSCAFPGALYSPLLHLAASQHANLSLATMVQESGCAVIKMLITPYARGSRSHQPSCPPSPECLVASACLSLAPGTKATYVHSPLPSPHSMIVVYLSVPAACAASKLPYPTRVACHGAYVGRFIS